MEYYCPNCCVIRKSISLCAVCHGTLYPVGVQANLGVNSLNSSSSNDLGKLDRSLADLLRPFAKEHFIGSAVIVSPSQVPQRPLEFQNLINTHIKHHIQQNRLPYRVNLVINGNLFYIDLSLADIFNKENVDYLVAQTFVDKIVPDADGKFSYSIYIRTVPFSLRSGQSIS